MSSSSFDPKSAGHYAQLGQQFIKDNPQALNIGQALLKNKKVQDLILKDPNLQQQLVNNPGETIIKNKELRDAVLQDPELRSSLGIDMNGGAEKLKESLTRMAQDPEVQAQLKEAAKKASEYAVRGLSQLGSSFKKYVEEGPAGIRLLCFFSGCFTFTIGVLGLLSVFQLIFSPFYFLINVYVVAFGLVIITVEADQERMATIPFLEHAAPPLMKAQKCLNEEAKFLTELLGRGIFYIFVGILMASECQLCLTFLGGVANTVMGVFLVMLHFGIEPDLDYLTENATRAYQSLPASTNISGDFKAASSQWQQSGYKNDTLLKALYKQATMGDVSGERPTGLFNAAAKNDYDQHSKLVGVKKDDAKLQFIQRCQMKGLKW